jgi:hypothetical protein
MWSQNWGQMIWGESAAAVPFSGPFELAAIGLSLLVLGHFLVRNERRVRQVTVLAVVFAALAPLTAGAVPHLFQNGTVADADHVNANFAAVEARLALLEAKTASLSVENGVGTATELVFSGVNLHVENGLGETDGVVDGQFTYPGTTNGLGNLIVGYGEAQTLNPEVASRGGSHNLVIGPDHAYSSYGALVAGRANSTLAPSSTVSGGISNTASAIYSSISGGRGNAASGVFSSLSGGQENSASGEAASVSGGRYNSASHEFASVSGGNNNRAVGPLSSVTGGQNNQAFGVSTVHGGCNVTTTAICQSLP